MRRSREFVFIDGGFYIVDFLKGIVKQCSPLKWIDLYNYQVQNGGTYENLYTYKRNINYVDYSNYNDAISLDKKENEQQHRKYIQPQLNNSHIYKHGKKIIFSEPIYGVNSKMDKISALCFWAFSSLQIKKFILTK